MSTSTSNIYVWVWLPEETSPVSAGVLLNNGGRFDFRYGNLYLERMGEMISAALVRVIKPAS